MMNGGSSNFGAGGATGVVTQAGSVAAQALGVAQVPPLTQPAGVSVQV
jgi:hypothetical protein